MVEQLAVLCQRVGKLKFQLIDQLPLVAVESGVVGVNCRWSRFFFVVGCCFFCGSCWFIHHGFLVGCLMWRVCFVSGAAEVCGYEGQYA
jgi:hypothetical protein